jgi:hypothetical protein
MKTNRNNLTLEASDRIAPFHSAEFTETTLGALCDRL